MEVWILGQKAGPTLEGSEDRTKESDLRRPRRQRGHDLGARMHHAIDAGLRAGHRTILCGTDSPSHAHGGLAEAVACARATSLPFFRPALDGGYVLVGTGLDVSEVFRGMSWGTASVMAQSRRALVSANRAWLELAAAPDIDEPDDLRHVPGAWLDAAAQS